MYTCHWRGQTLLSLGFVFTNVCVFAPCSQTEFIAFEFTTPLTKFRRPVCAFVLFCAFPITCNYLLRFPRRVVIRKVFLKSSTTKKKNLRGLLCPIREACLNRRLHGSPPLSALLLLHRRVPPSLHPSTLERESWKKEINECQSCGVTTNVCFCVV